MSFLFMGADTKGKIQVLSTDFIASPCRKISQEIQIGARTHKNFIFVSRVAAFLPPNVK
jgi:hypothetical protein